MIDGVLSNPIFGYQPISTFLCLQNTCIFESHVIDSVLNNLVFGYPPNSVCHALRMFLVTITWKPSLNAAVIFHCSFPVLCTVSFFLQICLIDQSIHLIITENQQI